MKKFNVSNHDVGFIETQEGSLSFFKEIISWDWVSFCLSQIVLSFKDPAERERELDYGVLIY